MSDPEDRFAGPPRRERVFNAPLPAVVIALSMPVLFYFQQRFPDGGLSMAFAPADLEQGRWSGLFTALLLHANWTHALMNAVAALAFGAPVARFFGDRIGPMLFLLFYAAAGVFASFGYALAHWDSAQPMVGASGAVFGLIGAATRLMFGAGRVAPLFDRRVLAASAAWMAVNLVVGLIGYAPGAEGADIAWEAHAAGFLFGLLAIGPLARLRGAVESGAPPTTRV